MMRDIRTSLSSFFACVRRGSLSGLRGLTFVSPRGLKPAARRAFWKNRVLTGAALFVLWPSVAAAQTPGGSEAGRLSGRGVTARVGDVTRVKGQGENRLIGMGIVTGLSGTGDGPGYVTAMRSLAAAMARQGIPVESLDDLAGTKNVALVQLEAVVPDSGAREGDLLDVTVTALAAKSLAGGQLLSTALLYQDPTVEGLFALASGSIVMREELPTRGMIRRGARMERDLLMNVVASGSQLIRDGIAVPFVKPGLRYMTLVIEPEQAGWPMAAAIAQAIDAELSFHAEVDRVAWAVDPKNVVVLLPEPEHEALDLAAWIRDVERTPILMESNEARVAINRASGTIVVTGDTRLSPVIVSQKGMTITVLGGGAAAAPTIDELNFVPLDAERERSANVQDLLEALNRLKVPFEDRVSILEQVHRAGKLHAAILYEG
jgi:flagellar P-ring protein precursor FlgI